MWNLHYMRTLFVEKCVLLSLNASRTQTHSNQIAQITFYSALWMYVCVRARYRSRAWFLTGIKAIGAEKAFSRIRINYAS